MNSPEIKRAYYGAIDRFPWKNQEIQRAYYGAIWLILIKKNDVEIQFTRGPCKNQRFSPGSRRPDLYRVSDRDIKINKFAKSAPDCRRAYYGAIPRARAFSECAQNPSVSVATPRSRVTGARAALRGRIWHAMTRFRSRSSGATSIWGSAKRSAKMCTAPKSEPPLRRQVSRVVGCIN